MNIGRQGYKGRYLQLMMCVFLSTNIQKEDKVMEVLDDYIAPEKNVSKNGMVESFMMITKSGYFD